jgi:N-acetylglucosamine kinase-like BadF-type ATPase
LTAKGYVLGIDGGGTKTFGVIADLNGRPLFSAAGGTSNPQVIGFQKASQVVLEVIQKCCRRARAQGKDLKAVVVGLAGAGRESDRRRAEIEIRRLARKKNFPLRNLRVESDARIALEGALGGESGLVLISGTGSIGIAKDHNGGIHRVGGWGRTIGDEGSGFAIGRVGLAAIARALDGRGQATMLTRLAAKRFGLSNPRRIISRIYQDCFDPSLLAPLVLKAAGKADKVSKGILEEAALELVHHVRVLLAKFKRQKKPFGGRRITVVLLGGMLERPSYLSRTLKKKIRLAFPRVNMRPPCGSPAYGGVLLALERLEGLNNYQRRRRA